MQRHHALRRCSMHINRSRTRYHHPCCINPQPPPSPPPPPLPRALRSSGRGWSRSMAPLCWSPRPRCRAGAASGVLVLGGEGALALAGICNHLPTPPPHPRPPAHPTRPPPPVWLLLPRAGSKWRGQMSLWSCRTLQSTHWAPRWWQVGAGGGACWDHRTRVFGGGWRQPSACLPACLPPQCARLPTPPPTATRGQCGSRRWSRPS